MFTFTRRELFNSLAAALLPIPVSEQSLLVTPNENVPSSLVSTGGYDLLVHALFGPASEVAYFYLTILPQNPRKAASQRSVANELFSAGLLPPTGSNAANWSAAAGQRPIETLEIEYGGRLYRLTGQLWLLVDNRLVLGPTACAALSEVPPGGKLSVTLAAGTVATLEVK